MAISDKLNYLIETKQLFKDRLNSLGAEITSSTTFRNYLNWLDTFYGEVSNKTDISENGVVGRTSQETTTGKNILPQDKYIASRTINGITYTNNGDGTFDLNGTATANTSLRIIDVGIFNLESGQRYYLYSSVAYNSTTFNMSIVTTESGTQKFLIANGNYTPSTTPTSSRLQFYIASGDTVNVQNVKLMLVKGADDTSYEPYTNGASPNPDYPQPINNLSGDVPYKVSGKNLNNGIDYKFYIGSTGTTYRVSGNDKGLCIEVNEESSYTISTTTTQNRYRVACCNSLPTTTEQRCYNGTNKDGTRDNIIINTTGYKYLLVNATDLTTIQIEKGSTATDFEPYIEPQTFNIPLGDIELCKIDTYEDKIYSSNGRFYLEKNVGKETDDGSSDEYWGKLNREINSCYGFRHNGLYSEILLCDKLTNYTAGQLYQGIGEGIGFSPAGGYLAVYIKSERINSYDTSIFRTFLANNPITYYYQLSTSTTTEITQENYPSLYNALKQIQDYLTAYKINKEFILGYSSPEIEY